MALVFNTIPQRGEGVWSVSVYLSVPPPPCSLFLFYSFSSQCWELEPGTFHILVNCSITQLQNLKQHTNIQTKAKSKATNFYLALKTYRKFHGTSLCKLRLYNLVSVYLKQRQLELHCFFVWFFSPQVMPKWCCSN